MRGDKVTADRYAVGTAVCIQDPDVKQAWCLAASGTQMRGLLRSYPAPLQVPVPCDVAYSALPLLLPLGFSFPGSFVRSLPACPCQSRTFASAACVQRLPQAPEQGFWSAR